MYLWLDGVYLKAGLEKAALLVSIGVKADGHKVVLAVSSGYRESTASWSSLLRDLKARRMNEPRLVVGDGNLGLWSALRNIFPGAEEQRCWNHRLVNLLTQVPKQRQGEARELLTKIPYQTSARQAQQQKRVFQNWCLEHGYERAAELIDENWEQMVSFYRFPRGHWRHLGTSNVVESPFAALRLRTDAAKRFKKVANATAVVWKCCCSPNASSGASTRPSYSRPSPPGSSITTAYRSNEANTRRPPPDLFTPLLTEPQRCSGRAQMLCVTVCLSDRDLAQATFAAWSDLSGTCHYHAYELAPTAEEVERLRAPDCFAQAVSSTRRHGITPTRLASLVVHGLRSGTCPLPAARSSAYSAHRLILLPGSSAVRADLRRVSGLTWNITQRE